MYRYEMDPTRTVGATEQTWDEGRTDGRTNRRTDRRSETNIPPQQLSCVEGITKKWKQYTTCIFMKRQSGIPLRQHKYTSGKHIHLNSSKMKVTLDVRMKCDFVQFYVFWRIGLFLHGQLYYQDDWVWDPLVTQGKDHRQRLTLQILLEEHCTKN